MSPWTRTRKISSRTPKHQTPNSMYIAGQTIPPTSSEIYRNQLADGSQKFHPTTPCSTRLQPRLSQDALYKSGYTYKLEFKPPQRAPSQRRNRSRKIIWYNPPYNKNVKSRIGREFLRLIDECFPAGHKLRKIFNRNTLKLSYSCMPNVQQII